MTKYVTGYTLGTDYEAAKRDAIASAEASEGGSLPVGSTVMIDDGENYTANNEFAVVVRTPEARRSNNAES